MKKLAQVLCVFLFLPAFTFAQAKVDAGEIIAKISRGEAISYKNVRIEGALDMTQLANKRLKSGHDGENNSKFYISTVTAPISFINCTFSGQVMGYHNPDANKIITKNNGGTIYNTNFEQEVLFQNCIFDQEVAFKYSEFADKVSFAGSEFRDNAIFKYTKFKSGPDFSKAKFNGTVVFKYVKFPENTDFSQVTFNGDTDFKYADFPAGVNFRKATFNDFANFKYSKLTKPNLEGATFKGSQDFKYTQVNGHKVALSALTQK